MILGLNYSSYHDSSIAIVDTNNRVHFAASEERYSRIKKDGRFPVKSLAQIDAVAFDSVAIPYLEHSPTKDAYEEPLFKGIFYDAKNIISPFPEVWKKNISSLGKPISYFDHHDSHAAAGIFFSGFERCNIITSDFGADNTPASTVIFKYTLADGLVKTHSADIRLYEPLCSIYTFTTTLLGFKPNHHEGKLTGLAATASSSLAAQLELENVFREFLAERSLYNCPIFQWEGRWNPDVSPELILNTTLSTNFRMKLSKFSDATLARAAQDIIEKKMLALLVKLDLNLKDNLVLSGGIFSNVKLNLAIKRLGFNTVYVCPPMGDEGLAIGAAVLLNQFKHSLPLHINNSLKSSLSGVFSGSDTSNNEFNKFSTFISSSTPKNLSQQIAQILASNHSVAVVKGNMEFGPRSLGHRSILHSASNTSINESLNNKLKRSDFMPFAPIMRIESAKEYLDLNDIEGTCQTAHFMTICVKATPKFKLLCPAVVHVDDTCRPQLVERDSDPFIYDVLDIYEKITGLPALINTSFNMHEEPIVCSFADALRAFIFSELDFLVFNDKLISQMDVINLKLVLEFINSSSASESANNFKKQELDFWKKKYDDACLTLDIQRKHIDNLEEVRKKYQPNFSN
jgi:carbamoyltransferase